MQYSWGIPTGNMWMGCVYSVWLSIVDLVSSNNSLRLPFFTHKHPEAIHNTTHTHHNGVISMVIHVIHKTYNNNYIYKEKRT